MALPTSGALSISAIKGEFGNRGNSISAFCGVTYYKSDNVKRTFTNSLVGNRPPISFSEFYGSMASRPVSPTGDVAYANGSTFTVPYYNYLVIKMVGGQAGGQGNQGFTNNGCGGDPTGKNGNPGGATSFGTLTSASGGAPNSGAGASVTTIIYADTTPGAPTRGTNFSITVGAGGTGGQGGDQTGWVPFTTTCGNFGKAGGGSTGSNGSLTVSVQ
jgi:hypothetical protein